MITIDGSQGEGGGQILRSSLALSLATGKPFRMVRIRAGRKKPGLQRQHLVAVHAATEVGQARVTGAAIDSPEITFEPGEVRPGDYVFRIGSAGSTTLVLQTVLPPLLRAAAPSTITLEGGTHNPFAPPFDFLEKVFLPLVNRLGPRVSASLQRAGFYPVGAGECRFHIEPAATLLPFDLVERGEVRGVRATAWIARLPRHIAERELNTISAQLGLAAGNLQINEVRDARGPGNAVCIEVASDHVCELFTAIGQRGVPAEKVAETAVREAQQYLDAGVPVGSHLSDQLLLPLVLAGGGSFRVQDLTRHAQTNLEVMGLFLEHRIEVRKLDDGTTLIRVTGP